MVERDGHGHSTHHDAVVLPLDLGTCRGPAGTQRSVRRRGPAHLIHNDSGDCLRLSFSTADDRAQTL